MTIKRRAPPVLPHELITEILSRVPVKYLLRFRCVCKRWKSLISDPTFVKLHLQISSQHVNLILKLYTPSMFIGSRRYNTVMSCPMPYFLHNSFINAQHEHRLLKSKYTVIGSCNGLLCLHYSYDILKQPWVRYWVRFWNPEMRLKSKRSPLLRVGLDMMFEDMKFGFGFDKSSDTYKVVAIFHKDWVKNEYVKRSRAKCYTMGGHHCWRDIEPFPAFPISHGYFLGGSLHWLACPNLRYRLKQLAIVSLDLGTETYKQVSLPIGCEYGSNIPNIGILGDCLCLYYDYQKTHFVIWQIREFGVYKSWIQIFNVSYMRLQIREPCLLISLVPLCTSEDGDVLILLCHPSEYAEDEEIHLESGDAVVIMYNWRDHRVERAHVCNTRVWAKEHVRSLVVPC